MQQPAELGGRARPRWCELLAAVLCSSLAPSAAAPPRPMSRVCFAEAASAASALARNPTAARMAKTRKIGAATLLCARPSKGQGGDEGWRAQGKGVGECGEESVGLPQQQRLHRSYFEETWGPMLERQRASRERQIPGSLAAKADNVAPRRDLGQPSDAINEHVQAMLDAYGDDSDVDAAAVHDSRSAESAGVVRQADAVASEGGAKRAHSAPPRPPSRGSGGRAANDAPRCGPRPSAPRGHAVD